MPLYFAGSKLLLGESPDTGRCLIAGEKVEGGKLLLSLPMEGTCQVTEVWKVKVNVIMTLSEFKELTMFQYRTNVQGPEDSSLPWSIELALQLLHLKVSNR